MVHNRKTSVSSAGQILDRLRLGGKKTATAGVLILIMLFMWARVVIGHRPAAAEATPQPRQTESAPRKGPAPVKVVELPKIPGRHDTIVRDFFSMKDRTDFRRNPAGGNTGTDTEVPVTKDNREVIQRVAQTMKLEAVLWSERPRAFINDQLLSVGNKLTVKDGAEVYEFEVLQIYVDSVLVGCDGMQLTLALARNHEVVK
jgi:hypothetical protein